jgi:hypothetical protein
MDMTFEHLSDGEFEEFAYDLLSSLGFSGLSWRRGSGKGGATADQGRDIEAQKLEHDVDGHARIESWFVQCKHFEKGVPPEKLHGAVVWASSERPAVLLVVASNFLSNSAKNWLENYERENRPAFRIKVWERKDLEKFVSSRPELAVKYKLDIGLPLQAVHPAHLYYVLRPPFNSLEHFFEALEDLDPEARDQLFSFAFHEVVNPRFRDPEPGESDRPLADLMLDAVDFSTFRSKCFQLRDGHSSVSEIFLIQAIVMQTLAWACRFVDPSESEAAVQFNRRAMTHFAKQLAEETNPKRRASLAKMVSSCQERIDDMPESRSRTEQFYKRLCESLLPQLYLEDTNRFAGRGR